MLSERLHTTFHDIATEAMKMVASNIDREDLAKGIDYVSIYAHSSQEFQNITQELQDSGVVAIQSSSGSYYKLHEPMKVNGVNISLARVRVYDDQHPERGYLDFEVKNYPAFRAKYLSRPFFSVISDGEEMLELKDPKFTVRAYFPSGPW